MDRDDKEMLIRLDQKMEDVRNGVGDLKRNAEAQWKRIDAHTEKLADHDGSLRWLTWAVRLVVGGVLAGVGYLFSMGRHG